MKEFNIGSWHIQSVVVPGTGFYFKRVGPAKPELPTLGEEQAKQVRLRRLYVAPTMPKIPLDLWDTVLSLYFQHVDKGRDEFTVSFARKLPETEGPEWKILLPPQSIAGASAHADRGLKMLDISNWKEEAYPPEGYVECGSSHSHVLMSAFYSGTDDRDEKGKPGLHIVVGRIYDKTYEALASYVHRGLRYYVDLREVIDFNQELPSPHIFLGNKVLKEAEKYGAIEPVYEAAALNSVSYHPYHSEFCSEVSYTVSRLSDEVKELIKPYVERYSRGRVYYSSNKFDKEMLQNDKEYMSQVQKLMRLLIAYRLDLQDFLDIQGLDLEDVLAEDPSWLAFNLESQGYFAGGGRLGKLSNPKDAPSYLDLCHAQLEIFLEQVQVPHEVEIPEEYLEKEEPAPPIKAVFSAQDLALLSEVLEDDLRDKVCESQLIGSATPAEEEEEFDEEDAELEVVLMDLMEGVSQLKTKLKEHAPEIEPKDVVLALLVEVGVLESYEAELLATDAVQLRAAADLCHRLKY